MVVFICGKCNDSLKKNKVDTHLPRCSPPSISCCDCGKDFFDDSYKAHKQCISEDKKYGAQDQQSLSAPDKEGKKQQEWLNRIKEAVKEANPSGPVESALNRLLEFDNIPRKKVKFDNFVRSCLSICNQDVINEVWNIFEKANNKQPDQQASKTKTGDGAKEKESNDNHQESSEQSDAGNKRKAEKESQKKSKKSKKSNEISITTEEGGENLSQGENGGVNNENSQGDEAKNQDKNGEIINEGDEALANKKEEIINKNQESSEQIASDKKRKAEKESKKKSKKSKKSGEVTVEENIGESDGNSSQQKDGEVINEENNDESKNQENIGQIPIEGDVGTSKDKDEVDAEMKAEDETHKDSDSKTETRVELEKIGWFKQIKHDLKSRECVTIKEFKKLLKKVHKSHKLTESKDELFQKAKLKLLKRRNYEVNDKEIKYVHIV